MAMKLKSLDKTNPWLSSKLNEYAAYLRKIVPKTESDANIRENYKGI